MSIAPFPHRYIVKLDGDELTSLPRDTVQVGAPPQFGGTDTVWSPEELLVGAVVTCIKTTFEAFARRDQLPMPAWSSSATGVLVKGAGGPTFSEIEVHVHLTTAPGIKDQALVVLHSAERNCIITRALNCPVKLTATAEELPLSHEPDAAHHAAAH